MKFRLLVLVFCMFWLPMGHASESTEVEPPTEQGDASAEQTAAEPQEQMAAIKPPPKEIESITNTCTPCHGADGNSVVSQWPKIAGQHEAYLVKQIKEIRMGDEGPRPNPAMYDSVKDLTDQNILDLAAYYAGIEQSPGKTKAAFLDAGMQIYRGGIFDKGVSSCSACHGPKGRGNDLAGFPRLSGQHADYTVAQLQAFKEGIRNNDIGNIMHDVAKRMSDDEMRAVAEYIAGLH